ncbi:NAD-binding protein [Crepidotus variabilis]|uniref:enoyl-[acyl-carrier-protein] reductase n=1 Tax=Crepidotus variabilis TaxID=179855 RepID=A0A9P6EAV8_9AGAR|nr:NAD-binding protein [Crepidotus variabilis]
MLSFTRSALRLKLTRGFASSTRLFDRAVVYSTNGNPAEVLRVLTYPDISPPGPSTVNIRFLLSPINPADLNVVEGVYPKKPNPADALSQFESDVDESPTFVGGNEGVARVTAIGDGIDNLKVNDMVVMVKQQTGTWATQRNVSSDDVLKLSSSQLTEVQAATLTVNPPTAYNMLKDFVDLQPGDWVLQNGANSAVGQAVIQIAAARGLKTINLIRDRPDVESLKKDLKKLGATYVLTYEDLANKTLKAQIKQWTGDKAIRLALNCVGGNETTLMARYLGQDGHLVSYGAMSKKPLSLPTSLFIFKNLTCHGFWQSQWYLTKSPEQRQHMMQQLVALIEQNKLRMTTHEIISISATLSDQEATTKIQNLLRDVGRGKILLKIE